MDINVEEKNDISVCRITGEITFSTSPDLRKRLIELIDNDKKKIVVSMKDVGYVDSSGMATMVEVLQKAKGVNGHLVLAEVQDKVQDILEMVKLKDIFDIYGNEEEAINSF